ncbi:MAG: hypothetical protein E7353_04545 [Clostridiales bacterium]|nr:hypothetical protein [Clostridiales bacterium]
MRKTSLFRKCITSMGMLAVSFVIALAFMFTQPVVASAKVVDNVNDIGSTFDSSIAGFSVAYDSDTSNAIDVAYTVVHNLSYNKSKFGELPSGLSENSSAGYAIIKTSPKADAQPISAGLTSATFTLNKDSFYRISVDVNAQSASKYGGAVVKLAATDESIYLMNGNSEFITTNGKWNKYSLFIATSQFEDIDVAINLTLGNVNGTKCLGYAAFDNLEVDLIDFVGFDSALSSFEADNLPNSYVEDKRKDTTTIESFDSASYTTEGDIYTQSVNVDGPSSYKADGNKAISITNREEDISSFGIVSINKDKPISFNKVTSPENGFYLITVNTKGDNFTGTASVTLNYKSKDSVVDKYKTFSVAAITDNTNVCHNNWRKNYFIIKSSVISDSEGYFTVEYGNDSSLCTGSILVDEIEIVSINFADFGKYSSDLTTASVVCDFDVTLDDTTGINGAFYQLRTDYYDVLRPNLWSITTASDDIEYELVSKESTGFAFSKPSFELDANNPIGNIVKIASDTETIFTLDSQAVELEATDEVSYYKVTVLAASRNLTGAGAATLSLVDTNGTAYSAIKIEGNNAPTLYTFNFKAKDSVSFYIRCSMGDTTYGKELGGKGELYIARITYKKITETEYKEKIGHDHCQTINFYYDNFNDFTLYNANDKADVKDAGEQVATLTNISTGEAKHGIVELDKINYEGHEMAGTSVSSNYPNRPELDPYLFGSERLFRTYGFIVKESNATLTINRSQTMSLPDENAEETNASSYYKVVVSARVIVTGDYGLTIGLKNTSTGEVVAQITDIKDTRIYEEFDDDDIGTPSIIKDQFVDFEFYVKLNDADVTCQIFMTLGGLDKHTQRTSGFVLFQGYQLTPSHEAEYETAVENVKNNAFYFDKETETYKYGATKDLSVKHESSGETTQGPTYNANDTWYLAPSILFGVLLIVAVLGFFIKKFIEKRKEKKEKKASANIDKNPTYTKRIDYSRLPEKEETADKDAETTEDNIDEFDEDYDMYAVHEIKAPDKKAKKSDTLDNELSDDTDTTEETVEIEETAEVVEEKEEEKKEEKKVEKPVSDEFDD